MARKKGGLPWLVILPVATIIAAGGWYAYSSMSASESTVYETANVTRGDLEISISSAGTVQPDETVEVGAQVSGLLEELLVEEGDLVEEGQLLAQIDATIAETSVESQRAQLRSLNASRRQQEASLDLARSEANRAELLFEADAISRADYESAQANLAVEEAQLESIDAQIAQQNSSLQADLAELEYTRIYAPISGTVVSVDASEGQTLNANQTAPTILSIADLTDMTVETDVSEADVLSVYTGQPAYFTTLGDSNTRWESFVSRVLPTPEVVNDVVLYKAILDVDNPDGLLRTDMTTQVFFLTGQAENALLVPIAALQGRAPMRDLPEDVAANAEAARRGPPPAFAAALEENPDATRDMVLVMEADGTIRPQPVLVGLQTRTQAEILFGLSEGQTVVTGGATAASIAPPSNRGNGDRPPGPPPGGFGPR
ncbi:efflux RND transporter periplasmic adaptor subunit [Ponticaulis sp.]|uniref:efflux RND transporter periplasmic adaptor subunit n=1 Tax=Ponticaulis sp. TaxID=2020902 RepID=UPI000B689CC4|nr:efflux RND transporter periplasmic adaptor subunit [Ponticaulis sp.]MAI89949.1 efflux transporter periplasmic adaptor subunit [Ponticaulis sp.]OUX99617.1 MAG: efflux transporter periplasmic adaptor subunit [Hyphomonadaceae bacterium TMED5]|tara:strand:+ start:68722 stop:70011 length:1290 start_codon:yes stop_codon:yes gene_type:complete